MANYPYYYPQQPYMQPQQSYRPMEQPPMQIGLKGRPVSSLDEVRATSIDFDGSVFYFPDMANKRIYTKQINLDGTSTLNVYELRSLPEEHNPQYVTREEFEATLAELKDQVAAASKQAQPQPPAMNF